MGQRGMTRTAQGSQTSALLIHAARPLLEVQELLHLAVHGAIEDVMPVKSLVELGP
jgi:hypothetical protein